MAETVNCNKVIKTCKYSWVGRGNGFYYCDYLCKTGKIRECSPEECDKYEKKERRSK